MRKARQEPERVVDTAGSIIGEVVGRDELCSVMIEDLRDRDTRRPHVVVGGVGTGKTALLVRLTQLLAERGAVPVPVRLRDARELDFRELARKRFVADANAALMSDAEGEKIWRQLCRSDRVVVLADGLEEALLKDKERDNRIRLAIRQADEDQLPLIIASLSEAFCRRQHALMTGGSVRRRTTPWQEALPGELKQLWKQMEQRRSRPRTTAASVPTVLAGRAAGRSNVAGRRCAAGSAAGNRVAVCRGQPSLRMALMILAVAAAGVASRHRRSITAM